MKWISQYGVLVPQIHGKIIPALLWKAATWCLRYLGITHNLGALSKDEAQHRAAEVLARCIAEQANAAQHEADQLRKLAAAALEPDEEDEDDSDTPIYVPTEYVS